MPSGRLFHGHSPSPPFALCSSLIPPFLPSLLQTFCNYPCFCYSGPRLVIAVAIMNTLQFHPLLVYPNTSHTFVSRTFIKIIPVSSLVRICLLCPALAKLRTSGPLGWLTIIVVIWFETIIETTPGCVYECGIRRLN